MGASRKRTGFLLPAMCGGRRWESIAFVTSTVLIVDDSPRFLEASSSLLARGGLDVVGVASTISEALAEVDRLKPDIVLVDIHLAGESGFELSRRLLGSDATAAHRVVLMSTHAQADFAELIAASPAAGFVPKDALSAEAVRRVLAEP